jgi:hypothetical protein
MKQTLFLFALSLVLACAASSAAGRGPLAAGSWGGAHIRLDVADDGTATLELDCAHGAITAPIVPDTQGAFRAAGTYVREHGGPVRQGEEDAGRPAVYGGTVDGERLTLTITLAEPQEEVGRFELERGRAVRLMKCL